MPHSQKHFPLSPALIFTMLLLASVLIVSSEDGPATERLTGKLVEVQMHNVMYHFQENMTIHIRQLGGELEPAGSAQLPVFDDKNSFTLRISAAEMAITVQSMANVLNQYVFARNDSPVKEVSLKVGKGRLKIKGKLHNHGDIGFETESTLSATGDGKIRLHAEKIRALHLPLKGLMDLFGVDIASLIKTGKVRGVKAEKDDLILDPELALPPSPPLASATPPLALLSPWVTSGLFC